MTPQRALPLCSETGAGNRRLLTHRKEMNDVAPERKDSEASLACYGWDRCSLVCKCGSRPGLRVRTSLLFVCTEKSDRSPYQRIPIKISGYSGQAVSSRNGDGAPENRT